MKKQLVLDKSEILKLIVGLKEADDLDLIQDDAVLATSCPESDNTTVRAMAAIVENIYDGFVYESSPEFLQRISGKSDQVEAFHRKMLDNEKLTDIKKRLGVCLTRLLEVDDAYDLVALPRHHRLDELKDLAASLTCAVQ